MIYVYVQDDGRVTTSHSCDYKGYNLLECLHDIEEEERRVLRWSFGILNGQVHLEAE